MNSIDALAAAQANGKAPPLEAEPRTLAQVVETFRQRLYLPDEGALLAALGAIAGNMLDGDPVWLQLVAPPSVGKTELLSATTRLPSVHSAATLTEGALLSGTSKRDQTAGARGGLLRTIGDFGIIVCKDFTSVLSMNRDSRGAVLAALREIYDGEWTRHVGTDGGKTLHWSGKIGLLAGCTPTIDRHYGVMSAMGDRFLLYRLDTIDEAAQANIALQHDPHTTTRHDLGAAVAGLFAADLHEPPALTEPERARLINLAVLVARSRSGVERDSYSNEILLVPGSEAPARLVKALAQLLQGLAAIDADRDAAWRIITKTALDSMPALRRTIIEALYAVPDDWKTADIAQQVQHPTNTTRRALEDLTAHSVTIRSSPEGSNAHSWRLADWARERFHDALDDVLPGMQADIRTAHSLTTPNTTPTCIPGKTPDGAP